MVEKAKCDNIKILLATTLPALQISNQGDPLCMFWGAVAELAVEEVMDGTAQPRAPDLKACSGPSTLCIPCKWIPFIHFIANKL